MPLPSRDQVIAEFVTRQGCPHIKSDDGGQLLFENGARIIVFNPLTREEVAEGEIEPPFAFDEIGLRRRLKYWKTFHKQEFAKWKAFRKEVLTQADQYASGLAVVPPEPQVIEILEREKVRIDHAAEQVAAIQAEILALPEFVERERQKEQEKAARAAERDRVAAIADKARSLSIVDPKTLEHPAIGV